MNQKTIVTLSIILSLCLIGAAVAIYTIQSPPSNPTIIGDKATLSQVTVSSINLVVNEPLTLSTIETEPDNTHLAGIDVTFYFYEQSAPSTIFTIGTNETNADGLATYTLAIEDAGTYIFYAMAEHPTP